MHINFKVLQKYKLQPEDVIYLIAIKQKETEFLIETYWKDTYERFEELSLIEYIKTLKKGESRYAGLRLSKKGKKLLEDLEEAETLEEDKKVFEFLKAHYLKLGKTVGNGAKTLRHIRDFRVKSGIQKNNLIRLCIAFLSDEENMNFNNVLEYCWYKAPTAFETRFQLEESRLYKFYLKHKDSLDRTFEEY